MRKAKNIPNKKKNSRREFIKKTGLAATFVTMAACGSDKTWEQFIQGHFRTISKDEKDKIVKRLEKDYEKKYGMKFSVSARTPIDNTLFGYALDISRCIGCRKCVYSCVKENNQSREPQIHWIRVLEMEKDMGVDLLHSSDQYNHELVPAEGHFYFPVACQQCENPPCTKVCPVNATWKEKDGIVVVDYNWCIGCRFCMSACPYGARHFNWSEPTIPKKEINTNTHYYGNRPRYNGVVEKCTFCIQRVREGRYPACVEICPVGARKFGNILDSESEIRYILENKRVLILKEELNTKPRFYYFY